MGVLSPEDVDRLTGLLTRALDEFQLRNFVFLATGEQLYEAYVGAGKPLRETIFDLLIRLEKEGITERFLDVVFRKKPFQFALRAYIGSILPGIPAGEPFVPRAYSIQEHGDNQTALRPVPELQRLVKRSLKKPDLRVWLDGMERIERQVCRVEASQSALGTGFLVGPGVVLTNWHVVQEARDKGIAGELGCRFDYKRLTNGAVESGMVVPVTAVLAEQPCSPSEKDGGDPDTPPPGPDDLDFALLQLAEPLAERGAIRLGDPVMPEKRDPIIIVQHPEGEPVRFAIDTDAVLGPTPNARRLRYTTNTEPGSSGSPCLTMDLELVALHHLGDPRQGPARYNQGIPIGGIRRAIIAAGHGARIGA